MRTNSKFLMTTIVLLIWAFSVPGYGHAHSCSAQALSDELTPGNTVILANQTDARFSQDFSMLLKALRLEWAILDSATVPDAVKDNNLILLGRLDAAYTGEIMRGMLTAEEIETIRTAGDRHVVLDKESPWAEGRSVYICTGADLLLTRNAAEEAVRAIIAGTAGVAWIRTDVRRAAGRACTETVDRLRYAWDDAELPLADLRMDVGAKPRRRMSAHRRRRTWSASFTSFPTAMADMGFSTRRGNSIRPRHASWRSSASRVPWSSQDLARLLYEQLGFISDCHLKIGGVSIRRARSISGTTPILELMLGEDGFQFDRRRRPYTVVSINGQDPEAYLFPSLNARGEPIYRLGTLSEVEPAPLPLVAVADGEERRFEIALQRSDFDYFSDDLFREDNLGGIPVIRVRTFSDSPGELNRFVETAQCAQGRACDRCRCARQWGRQRGLADPVDPGADRPAGRVGLYLFRAAQQDDDGRARKRVRLHV